MLYLWLKALHVSAAVIWAGGSLALAFGLSRLAVAGAASAGAGRAEAARILGRWNAVAVSPAEGLVWLIGLYMAFDGDWWLEGWLHLKLTAAVGIAALRGMSAARLRRIAGPDAPAPSASDGRFGRVATLAILLCLLVIAAMVIVRPF